jgi:hypothetical protein
MTRKLEELFDLPRSDDKPPLVPEEARQQIAQIDADIDKIDAALPMVRELDASDKELDDLAELAKSSYQDLTDLGFNVDSRFSAEIFAVASSMLGHALDAKTAKINKKLKMIDLQMKKLKLDQDQAKFKGDDPVETAQGQVLSRNDLLERLIGSRDQNDK